MRMLNKLLEQQNFLRTPELLSEGVPGKIMNIYMNWLNQGEPGYEKGAPYAIQSVHEQLLLAWYTLDFHFDDNRPWKATDKGKAIHDKVMGNIQMKSSSGKSLSNGMLNDTKDSGKVWDSIFEWKENKKRWGVFEKGLQVSDTKWSGKSTRTPKEFFLNEYTNPYGDICPSGGDPLKGKGFYLEMFIKRKFIERCKPGELA